MREEGPAALYKGFVPKVLRLAPGGGVLLLVVEVTLGLFRQGKPLRECVLSLFVDVRVLCSAWPALPVGWLHRRETNRQGRW